MKKAQTHTHTQTHIFRALEMWSIKAPCDKITKHLNYKFLRFFFLVEYFGIYVCNTSFSRLVDRFDSMIYLYWKLFWYESFEFRNYLPFFYVFFCLPKIQVEFRNKFSDHLIAFFMNDFFVIYFYCCCCCCWFQFVA